MNKWVWRLVLIGLILVAIFVVGPASSGHSALLGLLGLVLGYVIRSAEENG